MLACKASSAVPSKKVAPARRACATRSASSSLRRTTAAARGSSTRTMAPRERTTAWLARACGTRNLESRELQLAKPTTGDGTATGLLRGKRAESIITTESCGSARRAATAAAHPAGPAPTMSRSQRIASGPRRRVRRRGRETGGANSLEE